MIRFKINLAFNGNWWSCSFKQDAICWRRLRCHSIYCETYWRKRDTLIEIKESWKMLMIENCKFSFTEINFPDPLLVTFSMQKSDYLCSRSRRRQSERATKAHLFNLLNVGSLGLVCFFAQCAESANYIFSLLHLLSFSRSSGSKIVKNGRSTDIDLLLCFSLTY